MQNDRSLIDELKFRYQHGGMHMKLIFINAAVFLLIAIAGVIGRLISPEANVAVSYFLSDVFSLQADFYGFLEKPWGLITSIFAHFGFLHFLFNMLFLYFAGMMLEQFFGGKRLLYTYLIGGIAGGIFEILAHEIFPGMAQYPTVIVGASGSIMAIFIALAFYRPNMRVNLFGVLPVRLMILAGLYLLSDLLSLGMQDGTAHFAHIGGAIIGIISVQNPHSSRNFLFLIEKFFDKLFSAQIFKKSKPKMTATRGGATKSDYDYNAEKKARQQKTDIILDKISKSGYESLTKAEKEFLFNQSKNG